MVLFDQYLEVKSDYIPVFSVEADQKEPKTWKFFIPHDSMREIVLDLIKALNRGKNEDIKSIYITGGYGTGKTFGSFVVKHILEDEISEVEDYFRQYSKLTSLWPQFEAVRARGKYLVVHRSGTAEITSSERLLMEIQYSIRDTLERSGCTHKGGVSLYDAVYSRVTDSASTFDWPKAFEKYRSEFMHYDSPQDVIKDLIGNTSLTERVLRVLEREGVAYLNTVEETKRWIEEVINQNELKGIILIWDEFADYFKQNPAITTLQELAHATLRMPFYLFLITHLSIEQVTSIDAETRKKLMDRFYDIRFEMNPITAYQLMGNAILVNSLFEEEWRIKCSTLFAMVEKAVIKLSGAMDEPIKKGDFARLVPIHPFSAYLLSSISRQFTSSQRTLFRFLKESTDDQNQLKKSFNWFITNHSPEGWCWLTPDLLWDYFFTIDNDDFDQDIMAYIRYYNSMEIKLQESTKEDERRVLKCALLFMAMYSKVRAPLLQCLHSNLDFAFAGTPIREKLPIILNSLVEAGILSETSAGINDYMYMIPMVFEDVEKLKKIQEEVKRDYTFEKMTEALKDRGSEISGHEFGKQVLAAFPLNPVQEARIRLRTTSITGLKATVAKVQKDLMPYQIAVIFVLLQTEADRAVLHTQIEGCSVSYEERIAIIGIDTPFGADRFERWQADIAKNKYASLPEIRNSNARVYAEQASDHIEEWVRQICVSQIKIHYGDRTHVFIGSNGLTGCLEQIIRSSFSCGPETISVLSTLYTGSFGKDAAMKGLGLKAPTNPLSNIVEVLTKEGFWEQGQNGYACKPDHAISQMRALIDKAFVGGNSVCLMEIWEELMKPPFGLMPSLVSLFLWAFLMKDYIGGGYYLKDGFNTQPVHGERLAEYLDTVMKGTSRDLWKLEISKMRQDDEDFCKMMREVFGLSEEQSGHPAEVKKNVRRNINAVKYPLWVLNYLDIPIKDGLDPDRVKEVVEAICHLISTDLEIPEAELVSRIAGGLKSLKGSGRKALADLIQNKLSDGMKIYIQKVAPKVMVYSEKVGLGFHELMDAFRSKAMNEDKWLWQEDNVREKLGSLEDEYALIHGLNLLLGSASKTLEDAWTKCDKNFRAVKVPWIILKEKAGPTLEAFEMVIEFLKAEPRYFVQKRLLAELLEAHYQAMRELLKNQEEALVSYTIHNLKAEIAVEELLGIYQALPTMGIRGNAEDFVSSLRREISRLQTRTLLQKLKEIWVKLTGSISPIKWSTEHKMPIQWVANMEDVRLLEVFDVLNGKPVRHDEGSLKKLISYLEESSTQFDVLKDETCLTDAILKSTGIAGYAFLITVDDLKKYLVRTLGPDAYSWPMRSAEVIEVSRQFLFQLYEQALYKRVFQQIDGMPNENAKEYLKRLIQENPVVGLEMLRNGKVS